MCLVYAACVLVCSVVPPVWSLFVAEPDVDVVSYVSGDRALILLTPVSTPPDHCPVRGHLPRQLSISKYSCLNVCLSVRPSVRPSSQYPPHPITAQYAVTSLASYPSVSTAVSMSIRPSVRLVSTHPTRSLPSTRSPPSPAIHQ